MTTEQLALAFRAYVVDVCEELADVGPTLKRYELADGLAEEVQALLEETPVPGEADRG